MRWAKIRPTLNHINPFLDKNFWNFESFPETERIILSQKKHKFAKIRQQAFLLKTEITTIVSGFSHKNRKFRIFLVCTVFVDPLPSKNLKRGKATNREKATKI